MLSPNLQFLDVNPLHWRRLYDTVFAKRRERGLTILVQNGRIVKAHDSDGSLRPEWKSLDASEPEALARALYEMEHPDWVEVLDVAALRDYGMTVQAMHDWREDSDVYLARCFQVLSHFPTGLVRYPAWPRELEIAGIGHSFSVRLVNRVPDGETLVLGVFDRDEIWTCVICRVVGGRIELIAGSDAFLSENARWPHWHETRQDFLANVETAVGKLYLALLCTRSVFEGLVATDRKMDLLLDSIRWDLAVVYPGVEILTSGRE